MRFHIGAIPQPADFTSDPGWRPIREPGPILMQVMAVPVGFVCFLGCAWLWQQVVVFPANALKLGDVATTFIVLVLSFPALIVVHELIHAFVHPRFGRTPSTIIGAWPSRLLFYAHYEGELSCRRFLAVFLAPLTIISVLPLLVAALIPLPPTPLVALVAWLSTWNAFFACGDLIGTALVASQVPSNAIVRNHGWRTYWRFRGISAGASR